MPDVLLRRLEPPAGKIDLVLDTDTYNEIDDQFALVYAAIAENINLRAVHAAPFHNARSSGPEDGMEKSFAEINRVLDRLGYPHNGIVQRGSTRFLGPEKEPVHSPAVENLISLTKQQPEGQQLYVAAIGALTNVASALLLEPRLAERMALVWLGGHPPGWIHNREFNLMQDPHAAQVVLASDVPLIHVPCKNVAEHIKTTVPEMQVLLRDLGSIGEYLLDIFRAFPGLEKQAASKEIWDISAVAWLVNSDLMPSVIRSKPALTFDEEPAWEFASDHGPYRLCIDADRDGIFRSFVSQLRRYLRNL